MSIIKGTEVTEREQHWQERRLEEILKSRLDVRTKVRRINSLGFNDVMARRIVAEAEASYAMPAYYERIGPLAHSR